MNPQKNAKPQRKIRNDLLDKRFQLKYTLAAMLVTSLISVGLGYFLYQAHQEVYEAQQELYEVHRENSEMIKLDPDLDEAMAEQLQVKDEKIRRKNQDLRNKDKRVLLYLTLFLGLLVLCLGAVSIIATHKIAGPAYALCRMMKSVTEGQIKARALRQGDELQAVGDEFVRLVNTLREREEEELNLLKQALSSLEDPSSDPNKITNNLHRVIKKKEERLYDSSD
jgi:nitrogen fixation/metabolism regulation signal transduction histidine kinase